jgi:GWxTD domain-containing protein
MAISALNVIFFLLLRIGSPLPFGSAAYSEVLSKPDLYTSSLSVTSGTGDSLTILKNMAAAKVKDFEKLSGALKTLSRVFGNQLRDATKILSKVLAKSPNDVEALFLRGIVERSEGKLKEAEITFNRVISIDDRFSAYDMPNVWLQLGATYREKNEYDKAVDAFKQGALINLDDTWPLIELSFTFIEMNRQDEASEAFYGGLSQIKDMDKIDHLFIDCKDIAQKNEIAKWDSLRTKEEKLEYLKIFWKKRDPNPIDQVNQRLVEHYKRLIFARDNYSKAFAPWYDDRGLIYVKLGKPDKVYYGKPEEGIKENESWFYDRIRVGLFFDFVSNGNTFDLRSILDAADHSATVDAIYRMLEDRAVYNAYYDRLAQKIKMQSGVQEMRNYERTLAGGQGLEELTSYTNAGQYFEQAGNLQGDYTNSQRNGQKQDFVFDPGAPHLPINCNFASFRSSKEKSRLEFYYAIPFSQMNFIPSITQNNLFSSSIHLNMKIYDLKYNEILTKDTVFTIAAGGSELGSHFFLDQVDNILPAGKYVAAVELRNNEKDRVGIYQFVLNVRDYSHDTLTVSDIEIAQYVDNTLAKEKFVKANSNFKVVPNPAAGLIRTKPLTVYYEIYNLSLNKDGKSSYQISYSIKMLETNQSFLSSVAGVFTGKKEASTSSVTTKEGKSVTEREYIGFDVSELPQGIANLEIKVKDLNSGKETSSRINLTLQDEKKIEEKKETNKK